MGRQHRGAEWISTTEAGARLGLTIRTVYGLIDRGDLHAFRFGRVIRLKSSDVDRYIESARIEPGSLRYLHDPH